MKAQGDIMHPNDHLSFIYNGPNVKTTQVTSGVDFINKICLITHRYSNTILTTKRKPCHCQKMNRP